MFLWEIGQLNDQAPRGHQNAHFGADRKAGLIEPTSVNSQERHGIRFAIGPANYSEAPEVRAGRGSNNR